MKFFIFASVPLIILLLNLAESADEGPKIKIPLGELQGKYLKSRDGKIYSAFRGIPYAEPPERFEASKPVKSWKGVKDATNFGHQCLQGSLAGFPLPKEIIGSEDCLFINVFTPDVKGDFPVMVFIHGGAYTVGSADDYGGEFYVDENAVLVTMNYRLGALGFLSTGDDVITGNSGLKDQNLALRWVQENIQSFGGDKDRITILGESAGAGSVSHHILSPLNKGLFHRAIIQSGSALCPWALVMKPMERASELANKIGCGSQSHDAQKLKDCLLAKSGVEIIEAQNSLAKWHMTPLAPFGPSMERPSADAFLTEYPNTIMKEGRFAQIPLMATVNKHEGDLALAVSRNDKLREELNTNWEELAPQTFLYDDLRITGLTEANRKSISNQIKKFHFNDQKIKKSQPELSYLWGDRWFVHGVHRAALLHAEHSPVYAGIFGFPGLPSCLSVFFGVPGDQDIVTHGDDLKFFHDWSGMGEDNRSKELKYAQEKASKMLVKLWVQFASGSSAELKVDGVTWPKVSSAEIEAGILKWMLLDEKPEMLSGILDKRVKFWDDILEKFKPIKIPAKHEL